MLKLRSGENLVYSGALPDRILRRCFVRNNTRTSHTLALVLRAWNAVMAKEGGWLSRGGEGAKEHSVKEDKASR
jgi:hypothetical protein